MRLWHMFTASFRTAPRVPLAARQPRSGAREETVPLGMEATDLHSISAVNRKNDALDRVSLFGAARKSRDTLGHVAKAPDDETYAAWYARAFQKKGSNP